MWQKEKLHVLCNFFFCHYVFKKPSAAEASESVYMRERVKTTLPGNFVNFNSGNDILQSIQPDRIAHLKFTALNRKLRGAQCLIVDN